MKEFTISEIDKIGNVKVLNLSCSCGFKSQARAAPFREGHHTGFIDVQQLATIRAIALLHPAPEHHFVMQDPDQT